MAENTWDFEPENKKQLLCWFQNFGGQPEIIQLRFGNAFQAGDGPGRKLASLIEMVLNGQ